MGPISRLGRLIANRLHNPLAIGDGEGRGVRVCFTHHAACIHRLARPGVPRAYAGVRSSAPGELWCMHAGGALATEMACRGWGERWGERGRVLLSAFSSLQDMVDSAFPIVTPVRARP